MAPVLPVTQVNEMSVDPRMFRVLRLGMTPYDEAWRLQKTLCAGRLNGEIPDHVLLLQHPPTITIGKSGKLENILVTRQELERRGVSLYFTDRGGDVTYHGPGQLVAYPVMDLRLRGRDIHRYVRDLEEVVIRTLGRFSLQGRRIDHAGVWVGHRQVAAIGIAVRRWITMHGVSLNVNPELVHFGLINPCGLAGVPVTSIYELTGQDVSLEAVEEQMITEFAEVFGAAVQETAATG